MARKRFKIIWTPKGEKGLQQVRDFVAEVNPSAANALAKRIKAEVRLLKDFPERGAMIEELNDPSVRHIWVGAYRVIYHFTGSEIYVVSVQHGARLLKLRDYFLE
jgi:plasmid stabilization system protein ParE